MKSYEDIKHYKKMYYLANKQRLCTYSNNYYKYKKCEGEFSNNEIDKQLRAFIDKYKKHCDDKERKLEIIKKPIIISFK